MPPTLAHRLAHILDAILSIEDLMALKTEADLSRDRHLRSSLERELEIISEASRRIPEQIKNEEKNIDWQGMASFGNRLRHAYHLTDIGILYTTVVIDLPPLKAFVERVLAEEKKR